MHSKINEFYFFVLLISSVNFVSLMPDLSSSCPDTEDGKLFFNSQSTPYGNLSAGIYKKKNAETITDCIDACCEDTSCNVAFLFNTTCYTIQCRSYELCKPLKRSGKKFEKAYLVAVRLSDVKYVYDDFTDADTGKSFTDIFYHDDSLDDPDKDSSLPLLDSSGSTTAFFASSPKSCVYGIENDCPEHETCKPKNKRSRSGICHCEEGYEREIQGLCLRKRVISSSSQYNTLSPSTGTGPVPNKSSSGKSISTTSSPVHQLVVSAGDNVTLQLPENEVTLSAYALKQQDGEGDGYKYAWTLISHPEGDETGTMQDQNTKNLKLSKLRAGLYTFKVTVSSENAVGEAMVNVTVLPRT